jgi:hypothetical protein
MISILLELYILSGNFNGSIHSVAADLLGQSTYNGWDFWFAETEDNSLTSIDTIREKYRLEVESEAEGE